MPQSFDLYVDTSTGQLVSAGSAQSGSLPALTRNDNCTFRLRLLERDAVGLLRDTSTSSVTARLGIGSLDAVPSEGEFKLTTSTGTSPVIAYNATTAQVANAVSAIAGNVTVATAGTSAWIITAATANTALSFTGVTFTLFPSSTVAVGTRRAPAAGISAQQSIQLRCQPAVLTSTFTSSPTSGVVTMSKLQDGGSGLNETYSLKVGRDAIGGQLAFIYGAIASTAVPVGASAVSYTAALTAVSGIGLGNISVQEGNNQGDYTITFTGSLGNLNVTTGLALDASGVIYASFLESTVTMSGADLDALFASSGSSTITPTLEIEVVQSGKTLTALQIPVTVRKDLILA